MALALTLMSFARETLPGAGAEDATSPPPLGGHIGLLGQPRRTGAWDDIENDGPAKERSGPNGYPYPKKPMPTWPVQPSGPQPQPPRTTRSASSTTASAHIGWSRWWLHHRESFAIAIRRDPNALLRPALGPAAPNPAREAGRKKVVPVLRALTNPERDVAPDVRAAALRALGRFDASPFAAMRLIDWVNRASPKTVESAALAGIGALLHGGRASSSLRTRVVDHVATWVANDGVATWTRVEACLVLGAGRGAHAEKATPVDVKLVKHLVARLDPEQPPALQCAALMCLALQNPAAVSEDTRTRLVALAQRGAWPSGPKVTDVARGEALRALAALDPEQALPVIERVCGLGTVSTPLQLAVLESVRVLAPALAPERRPSLETAFLRLRARLREPAPRAAWPIAAGALLRHDPREDTSKLVKTLFSLASTTKPSVERSAALLGLGIALHDAVDTPWQERAEALLKKARSDTDWSVKSAALIASALRPTRVPGVEILGTAVDPDEPQVIREAALEALGFFGRPNTDTLRGLRSALREAVKNPAVRWGLDESLCRASARALTLCAPELAAQELADFLAAKTRLTLSPIQAYALADTRSMDSVDLVLPALESDSLFKVQLTLRLLSNALGTPNPWPQFTARLRATPGLPEALSFR